MRDPATASRNSTINWRKLGGHHDRYGRSRSRPSQRSCLRRGSFPDVVSGWRRIALAGSCASASRWSRSTKCSRPASSRFPPTRSASCARSTAFPTSRPAISSPPRRDRLPGRNHPARNVPHLDLLQRAQPHRPAAGRRRAERLLRPHRRQRRRAAARPARSWRTPGRTPDQQNFLDAEYFMTHGGQKGLQLSVLKPGVYPLNLALFQVKIGYIKNGRDIVADNDDVYDLRGQTQGGDAARHLDHPRAGGLGRRRALVGAEQRRRLQGAHRQDRRRRPDGRTRHRNIARASGTLLCRPTTIISIATPMT